MFCPLSLAALLLAAGPPAADAGPPSKYEVRPEDAWLARELPTLTLGGAVDGTYAPGAGLGVLATLDGPAVDSDVTFEFRTPAEGGGTHLIFRVKVAPAGGKAIVNVAPPDLTGWGGADRLIVTAELAGLPQARDRRVVRLAPPDGRTPSPDLPPVDRGLTVDANAASRSAAETPADPAATVEPGERFRVRGTYRDFPLGDRTFPRPILHELKDGRGVIYDSGLTPTFAEGEPGGDGKILYWFETELTIPRKTAPGRFTLELRPHAVREPGWEPVEGAFPLLTIEVAEPRDG